MRGRLRPQTGERRNDPQITGITEILRMRGRLRPQTGERRSDPQITEITPIGAAAPRTGGRLNGGVIHPDGHRDKLLTQITQI